MRRKAKEKFLPKAKGTEYLNLSRLKAPCSRPLRYQIRSCLRKEKKGWDGDSLYQVLPSLLQPPELHPDGDPDVFREWPLAKQMGS